MTWIMCSIDSTAWRDLPDVDAQVVERADQLGEELLTLRAYSAR